MTKPWWARWEHRPECNEHECYCADPEDPDPICECGRPGWACCCWDLEQYNEGVTND